MNTDKEKKTEETEIGGQRHEQRESEKEGWVGEG